MANETETPKTTLEAATQANMLPNGDLALLGTFLKQDGAVALIRTPRGKIATVGKGDRIGRSRVMAIEDGAIVLARGDTARRLHMPGG